MESLFRQLLTLVVATCVLVGLGGAQGWAASGSCQVRTDGKLDCMEFIGTLPAGLKTVCTLGGGSQWVDSACPQDNVLGFCEVPRNDNIRHRVYCYRMAEIPDAQALTYCRMGCNGTFSAAPGGSSRATGSSVAPSGATVKTPGSR